MLIAWSDHAWLTLFFLVRVSNEDVALLEQSGIMYYTGSVVETYDFKLEN